MAPWKDQDTTVQINETELQQNSQSPSTIPVLARWPINPKPLRSNRWTEKGLDAYDIILCLTPVALIIEAILCVVAAHQDRYNTGFWVDSIGNLTRELIRVNGQVSKRARESKYCDVILTAFISSQQLSPLSSSSYSLLSSNDMPYGELKLESLLRDLNSIKQVPVYQALSKQYGHCDHSIS